MLVKITAVLAAAAQREVTSNVVFFLITFHWCVFLPHTGRYLGEL